MIIDPPKLREAETALQESRPPNDSPSAENAPVYPPSLHHLHLDPGPRQRLARKITPKGLCFGLAFLVTFFLGLSILSFIQVTLERYSEPHFDMKVYQDPKSGVTGGPGVVKPLIGKKGALGSRFDVVATVWVREGPYLSRRQGVELADSESDPATAERVLFSKTVFSNVSVQDRRLRTSVNFEVPTDIFKQHVLHDTDLRASFVLIPLSPSFLDKAVNYSTVNSKSLHLPPVRYYSPGFTSSLTDEIVDSHGISTRLLEFHPIISRCRQRPAKQEEYPMDDDDDDDDSEWTESFQIEDAKRKEPPHRLHPQSTVDLPALDFHPYIITRTYLRVVDMTLLYNRKAYDKQHKALKRRKLACTKNRINNELSCQRNFVTHGNFETKIRVQYHNQKPDHEWAYAPYMDTAESAWGPKDLIPIPVNREECAPTPNGGSSLLVPDESSINITWHLTYSGQEWGKLFYGDIYSRTQQLNMSASEGEKTRTQWQYANTQGLIGHPYRDDFHPRRQFVLRWLSKSLVTVNSVIMAHYFHTLASTNGLSVGGTKMYGLAWIINYILSAIAHAIADQKSLLDFVVYLIWRFIPQITAFLMLKVAWRVDFEFSRKDGAGLRRFVPGARIVPPTHHERRSLRLEQKISTWNKFFILCCLGVIVHTYRIPDYHIINPRNPARSPHKTPVEEYIETFQEFVVIPLFILGKVLQLIHNVCSRTFAGTSKLAVIITFLAMAIQVASESERVVGHMDVHDGLRLGTVCVLAALMVELAQSWMFESVSSIDEGEDSR